MISQNLTHRRDHAVVLFPGATAAKEGDEENHHTDSDDDDRSPWSWRILDHKGFVHRHLNHNSHDNQRKATYLQQRQRERG